ncbi:MAG: methyltransferase domain-containing protein [Defluviicoccus sp.]|nr:methyltransferase domain-containing protein [Defluviicoccus sp.]MDG4592680.1 methyltransferase domain-containing protein [Defluviicoccus sp.]MDS4010158.1 methyltransferase domain-containing protein [Defluviicoccus sp.]MDS4074083.1 methyltransferase domain-containing protein [Defluviicoccus sp.]
MDYAAARAKMVANQIRTNRITDPAVIAAMAAVPREAFLPAHLQGVAYIDEDVALGGGRFLLEPLVTAQLLQVAELAADDVVLIVGCGVGYDAAVAAQIAGAVVGLESDPGLVQTARRILTEQGFGMVTIVEGPLAQGFARQAPYDVIVFAGAVAAPPAAITEQLAEGGRMVAVIADGTGIGRGTLFVKAGGIVSHRVAFDAATPFLAGFEPQPQFSF